MCKEGIHNFMMFNVSLKCRIRVIGKDLSLELMGAAWGGPQMGAGIVVDWFFPSKRRQLLRIKIPRCLLWAKI